MNGKFTSDRSATLVILFEFLDNEYQRIFRVHKQYALYHICEESNNTVYGRPVHINFHLHRETNSYNNKTTAGAFFGMNNYAYISCYWFCSFIHINIKTNKMSYNHTCVKIKRPCCDSAGCEIFSFLKFTHL